MQVQPTTFSQEKKPQMYYYEASSLLSSEQHDLATNQNCCLTMKKIQDEQINDQLPCPSGPHLSAVTEYQVQVY